MFCGFRKPLCVNLLVTCFVALYLCLGALILKYLEQVPQEEVQIAKNSTPCLAEVLNLWNDSNTIIDEDFVDRLKNCLQEPDSPPDWNFWSALLFAFSVTTTIGYGHVSPSTVSGRIFFFFYALFGIPLNLIYLANLGKYMMLAAQMLATKIFKKLKKENEKDEEMSGSATAVFLIFFPIYWIVGSLLFVVFESIGVFDSFYFNFVTLTTIGFGDIYPQNKNYMFLSLLYIAVGLALTSNCIDILSDYLKKLHYFGRKLDNLSKTSVWFGAKRVNIGDLLAQYAIANNLLPPDENLLQTLLLTTIDHQEQAKKKGQTISHTREVATIAIETIHIGAQGREVDDLNKSTQCDIFHNFVTQEQTKQNGHPKSLDKSTQCSTYQPTESFSRVPVEQPITCGSWLKANRSKFRQGIP